MRALSVLSVLFLASAALAAPCQGIKRGLPTHRVPELEEAMARQIGVKRTKLLDYFMAGNWRFAYIDTFETDETFLFYRENPEKSHFAALWAGAAKADEQEAIAADVRKQAPDAPANLLKCFAWYAAGPRNGS